MARRARRAQRPRRVRHADPLRPALAEALPEIYERAREHALLELHDRHQITLGESLPLACPYTLDQILGDWWPEWSDAG